MSKKSSDDLQSHAGLIRTLARRYWELLPTEHRRYIDLDDFINEGVIFFLKVSRKYESGHATKFSTFLYHTLENFYRSLLQRYRVAMRLGDVVSFEDVSIVVGFEEESFKLMEAERRVERALHIASPGLVGYLQQCFVRSNPSERPGPPCPKCERLMTRAISYTRPSVTAYLLGCRKCRIEVEEVEDGRVAINQELISEMQHICRVVGVKIDDFRRVMVLASIH